MNTTLTAAWFTPEQADAFVSDAGIAILRGAQVRDGQVRPAEQYGDNGWIAGVVTDAEDADDILRAQGLRRTGPWTTQDGYNAAPVETL